MGLRSRAILAGGLGFTAAFVVACGGTNGLLTADQGSTLSSRLDAVSKAVNSGNCTAATTAANAFNTAVGNLPPAVSTKLVQNLGDGAQTVEQLAAKDCASGTKSSTSTSTSSTTSTQPTSTTTTTVTSTPTTTTSSSTATQTGTATNPGSPGTSTTTNGGASLGGTGTSGNGGNGQ
jgi:hypothetical protein